jgi:RNA polymerase sigma factor (sigma-70 family)
MLSLVAAPPRPLPAHDPELAAALAGQPEAVTRLVRNHEAALRSVTRFYRLSRWDADDVIQLTWVQFLEHGSSVRDPGAVRAWLTTTARRLCLRTLQRGLREAPHDDPLRDEVAVRDQPGEALLESERRAVLGDALRTLPERHRNLMHLLVAESDLGYDELGRRLGMPVGSIGPIRARCLARLRRHAALRALHAAS